MVRDAKGERVCVLAGHRAVVGDEVTWVEVQGSGGKINEVLPRERTLVREDFNGRTRVVASHLGGLAVVASTQLPPYRPGLMDRYQVAASAAGLDLVIILTKTDLGTPDLVSADLAWRAEHGVDTVRCNAKTGEGVDAMRELVRERGAPGPWALVGHSGVGKTSLAAALLPDINVGPIGEVSEFWGTGQHTTTGSRIYELENGLEIADSPGIRTFLPSGLQPENVRDHFPGIGGLGCRYRDCLHRPDEDGCIADTEVDPAVLVRYRRLLGEVVDMRGRLGP